MKDCRLEGSKPEVLSLILLRCTNDLQGLGCPTGTLNPFCQNEDYDGDVDDADNHDEVTNDADDADVIRGWGLKVLSLDI